MATIHVRSNKKYGEAIALLYQLGGLFWTRHPRKLAPANVGSLTF